MYLWKTSELVEELKADTVYTESGVVGFGEVIEELRVAKQMLDEGLLTEQDYEHKKNTALTLEPSGQVQLH